jgi:hypothetical protein
MGLLKDFQKDHLFSPYALKLRRTVTYLLKAKNHQDKVIERVQRSSSLTTTMGKTLRSHQEF